MVKHILKEKCWEKTNKQTSWPSRPFCEKRLVDPLWVERLMAQQVQSHTCRIEQQYASLIYF